MEDFGTPYDAVKGEGYTFERTKNGNCITFMFHGYTAESAFQLKNKARDIIASLDEWEISFEDDINIGVVLKK